MMIRNTNRNISVAKGHGYTFEKVKFAKNFVEKSGRNTTIQDWVDAYNHIKDANETAQGCQACKAAKFTAAVRNYARYGYMTLLNEGHSPEEFKDEPVKTAEDELLENALESLHNVQKTIENDVQEVVDKVVKVDEISKVDETTVTQAEVVSEPSVELPVVDVQPEAVFTETEQTVEGEQVTKPKRVRKSKK